MQNLWKWHNQNKGLTLIELVCAVGIFSLIGATICSVMIISAKNYQRDSAEIELQQEAQMTANQIQDLIIDAIEPVTYWCKVGGTDYQCNNEVAAIGLGALDKGDRTLKVEKGDRCYEIAYLSSGNKIVYTEYIKSSGVVLADKLLMAENVTAFSADVTNFTVTGDISLNLSLSKGDRSFASSYTVTGRNQPKTVDPLAESPVSISTEQLLVLEPNETHELLATVVGDTGVSWSIYSGNTSPNTQVFMDSGVWKIRIGADENASEIMLQVKSNLKREDGITPQAQKDVKILVRKVTNLSLNVNLLSGDDKQENAVYLVTANMLGNNLERVNSTSTDTNNYVNPKTVEWNCQYSVGGITVANPNNYFMMTDVTDTSFKLTLKKTIQPGDQLAITGEAKHPAGYNRTGIWYGDIFDSYTFSKYYFFDFSKLYRGSDENQGTIDVSVLKYLIQLKKGVDTDKVARYYRFREIKSIDSITGARTYGPWTEWAPMTAEGGNVLNLRPSETYRFECDKDYEIQIKFFLYKDSESNQLWPFEDTPDDANIIEAEIHRVKLAFNSSKLGLVNARTCGEESAPKTVACNQEIDFTMVSEELAIWGFNFNHNQNCLMMKVEKLTDGAWVAAAASDYTLNINGITQAQKVILKNPGTYRIVIGLKNIPYRTYNAATKTVTDSFKDYWIGNETNGDGIFYIKAQ